MVAVVSQTFSSSLWRCRLWLVMMISGEKSGGWQKSIIRAISLLWLAIETWDLHLKIFYYNSFSINLKSLFMHLVNFVGFFLQRSWYLLSSKMITHKQSLIEFDLIRLDLLGADEKFGIQLVGFCWYVDNSLLNVCVTSAVRRANADCIASVKLHIAPMGCAISGKKADQFSSLRRISKFAGSTYVGADCSAGSTVLHVAEWCMMFCTQIDSAHALEAVLVSLQERGKQRYFSHYHPVSTKLK